MTTPLTDLPGIGPATSQLFVEAGFITIESIANADLASLEQVKWVGPHRAVALRTVAGASSATTASTDKGSSKSKGKSKGKSKNK